MSYKPSQVTFNFNVNWWDDFFVCGLEARHRILGSGIVTLNPYYILLRTKFYKNISDACLYKDQYLGWGWVKNSPCLEDLPLESRNYIKGARHCLICDLLIMTDSAVCACRGAPSVIILGYHQITRSLVAIVHNYITFITISHRVSELSLSFDGTICYKPKIKI